MNHPRPIPDPSTQNPDAVLFRTAFGDPETAADLMRSDLPAAIADMVEWDSLRTLDCSFVPASASNQRTDIWFAARIGGMDGFLMLLCDRASALATDESPLRYVLRFLERWLDEHDGAEYLPPIVPYMLHLEEP